MNLLEATVLGVVQGVTEFLPVSSTAHLRVVPALLGWIDPGAAFTAVTQLGTMLATLVYFRRDLTKIAVAWLRGLRDRDIRGTVEYRMGWYLVAATVPIGALGLLFRDQVETGARNLWIISSALVGVGVLMFVAERVGDGKRRQEEVKFRDAMAVGLAQAAALVPGVSRSGATLTAGLFLGLRREVAARFSFLLSVPAVVLSGLFEARKLGEPGGPPLLPTAVATALAFIAGYAAIAWLLRFLSWHSTSVFVLYRLALGALLFVLLATGALRPT